MIQHFNVINALSEQMMALLDLIECAHEECTDIKSMKTAAEMVLNMHDELMQEVNLIEEEYKDSRKLQQDEMIGLLDELWCKAIEKNDETIDLGALAELVEEFKERVKCQN